MTQKTGDSDKWKGEYVRFGGWNTQRQRRIQEKEARLIFKWLIELNLSRYDILEIGCGNGYVGIRVAELLTEKAVPFCYHFTDLLPQCVAQTRGLAQRSRVSETDTRFSVLDVYRLDQTFEKESQSIIISTGFASAATYQAAVPFVSKILKEEGVLIADFVNNLSLLVFLSTPVRSLSRLRQYRSGSGKSYHFGILGIRNFFTKNRLHLVKSRALRIRRNPLVCMFIKKNSRKQI